VIVHAPEDEIVERGMTLNVVLRHGTRPL
jgi:hypothetical protein